MNSTSFMCRVTNFVVPILACLFTFKSFAAETTSKIEPMHHIRGQLLSERLRQVVELARGMAEMGLGYEAARLLKSTETYSLDEERVADAKRILETWGIHEIEINHSNAETIRSAIREILTRNRKALLDHKRVQTLVTVGRTSKAAKLISGAKQVKLTGESKEARRRILNGLNLSEESLSKTNDTEALEARTKLL